MASQDDELMALAAAASRQAYAPYSQLHVGAAIETVRGGRYAGCNVENGALPSGGCAELHAIGAAILAEGPTVQIARVAISATDAEGIPMPIPPCGACRQRIVEFGRSAEVCFLGPDARMVRMRAEELLPQIFVLGKRERS